MQDVCYSSINSSIRNAPLVDMLYTGCKEITKYQSTFWDKLFQSYKFFKDLTNQQFLFAHEINISYV